jgi:deoxycytidine triphosphate deaminase
MKLLTDNEYSQNPCPVTNSAIKNEQIKPASLNLTIGEIFVPGAAKAELGGVDNPITNHFPLEQGATVVIRTAEIVRLIDNRSAIAFPPSHVSLKGLLMTNPGHVDPGYVGPLSVRKRAAL